jgi:uncharacterized protein
VSNQVAEFAAYLRTGGAVGANLAPARAAVYRKLFLNNVESLLRQAFPVAVRCLSQASWAGFVSDFFRLHVAQSPLFPALPAEFLRFAQTYEPIAQAHPALLELMQYEYAETVLHLAPDTLPAQVPNPACVQISPLAMPLAYAYPVHTICAENPPTASAPSEATYLLLWRNRAHAVCFQKLDLGALQLLLAAHQALPMDTIPRAAHALVQSWLVRDVLIGLTG